MKFGTHIDCYLLRMSAKRHRSTTRIARDIGDRRSVADKRRYVDSKKFFRFRSFFDPQGVWGFMGNLTWMFTRVLGTDRSSGIQFRHRSTCREPKNGRRGPKNGEKWRFFAFFDPFEFFDGANDPIFVMWGSRPLRST